MPNSGRSARRKRIRSSPPCPIIRNYSNSIQFNYKTQNHRLECFYLMSWLLQIGQTVLDDHRKWKWHPSHVPSGHRDGRVTWPVPGWSPSQRKLTVVVRPFGHALVALKIQKKNELKKKPESGMRNPEAKKINNYVGVPKKTCKSFGL